MGSVYDEEMGKSDGGMWTLGNTILFEKPNKKLILVGSQGVSEIELPSDENVVRFVSFVGMNDVPYP